MTRILVSALAALLIHGALLFFLPFFASPPGTISPQDHGIVVQISHLSPEPEPKADPALAPDMPPVPRPDEKQPPEPVPDIQSPPPPSTQIKATPEPADITARKDLMPKKQDLTLSPPPPEAEAHTPERDAPEPVNPDPKPPDAPSSDNRDRQPRKIVHQDRPETRKAHPPPTGMTASTAGNPDAIDPDAPPRRIKAVPLYKENPPPRYPGNARRRGHAGTVMLMVFVSEKGGAQQIRIFESSGYTSLDRAAENAVAAWRFEPGTSDGVPTGMWVKIPITFKVNK